jgi:putative ABC transport system permease protein
LYYDGGWVLPGEIRLLRRRGAPAQEEMFYNFQSANTNAQMGAELRRLKRALRSGAITSSQSYLVAQQGTSQEQSWNTPFITAFVIIALALAVLIVADVVAAAVLASQRRIGVLKSIGFTPRQVTAIYLAQIGAPALVGAAIGALLGNHWALPLIETAPTAVSVTVPAWIDLTAPVAMLTLSGVAAAVPALRAGRMSTVQAITGGLAPRAGRGYLAHRLANRLRLPRPMTIGLSAPFSRPARSAMTLVSITAGLTAAVMAIGLNNSIDKINNASIQGLGQVQVQPSGVRDAPFPPGQDTAVASALQAQPGTLHYIAESDAADGVMARSANQGVLVPNPAPNSYRFAPVPPGAVVVRIRGPLNQVNVIVYNGEPSWLGWALIAGRWYRGDEIDATPDLLADVHKRVGQSIVLTVNGTPVTARIAGEVFTPNPGPTLFVSWQTLGRAAAATLAGEVTSYDINLKPGTTTNGYINAVTRRLGTTSYFIRTPAGPSIAFNIQPSYFHRLALLVVVLAALGVLNSVLMATRERLHDLGIYKALGMTPRQIIAMVLCWMIAPTIIAATVALPVGLIVQDRLVVHLAAVTGPLILPSSFVHVLGPGGLALLTLAALAIAAAGALGPATWAAASKATTALQAE